MFYNQPVPDGVVYENKVTLRSTRRARMYEPEQFIPPALPIPLLMIVGVVNQETLGDTGLAAYQRALPPKKLVTIPGGHFDAYKSYFVQTSGAACDWFIEHLAKE